MLKGLFAVLLATVMASAASIEVTGQALAFDVASVRENRSGLIPSRFEITRGGELRIVNMPLREIIRRAYGIYVRGSRPYAPVENEPEWAGERRLVSSKRPRLEGRAMRGTRCSRAQRDTLGGPPRISASPGPASARDPFSVFFALSAASGE